MQHHDSAPQLPAHPLAAIHGRLCAPFPDSAFEGTPPVLRATAILDRLDAAATPGGWFLHVYPADIGAGLMTVAITVRGVQMTGIGERAGGQSWQTATDAAIRAAAALFGIGRDLAPMTQTAPHAEMTRPYTQQPPHHANTNGDARVMQRPDNGQYQQQPQQNGDRPVLPATEAQLKAIYAIARGAHAMDDAEVEARCRGLYSVTPSALSRRQASEFIDALKAGR